MGMKTTMAVIGKQKWDMQGEDGRQVKGAKVFAYDGENIKTDDKEGIFATSFNIQHEQYGLFEKVPANYELELSMKVGSKGQFNVVGAKYVSDYKI